MNPPDLPPEHGTSGSPEDHALFETRLKDMVPRSDRLDRDRLIFLAGRASVESPADVYAVMQTARTRNRWSTAVACLTTAAVMLLVFAFLNREDNRTSPAQVGNDSIATPAQSWRNSDSNREGSPSDPPISTKTNPSGGLDVDSRSTTTRDWHLFSVGGLASHRDEPTSGQPHKLGPDPHQEPTRGLKTSDWQRVFDDLL